MLVLSLQFIAIGILIVGGLFCLWLAVQGGVDKAKAENEARRGRGDETS